MKEPKDNYECPSLMELEVENLVALGALLEALRPSRCVVAEDEAVYDDIRDHVLEERPIELTKFLDDCSKLYQFDSALPLVLIAEGGQSNMYIECFSETWLIRMHFVKLTSERGVFTFSFTNNRSEQNPTPITPDENLQELMIRCVEILKNNARHPSNQIKRLN